MGEESPKPASTPTGAVFLSYASQDVEAAQKICDALRAAGIEVWFDQSELRGGDAWDRRIREQIHDCRLFIAVISAHTETRDEGYFRREWSLAVDRTRDMVHKRAFLIPVAIDGTPERGASVPEKFHELQWTRLLGGDTPAAFVERIRRLLSPETPSSQAATSVSPMIATARPPGRSVASPWRSKAAPWVTGVALAAALTYVVIDKFAISKRSAPTQAPPAQTEASPPAAAAAFNPPPHSVAVLPFVNMSGDKDQEYFSDGVTEELITALSQVSSLKVIARTSSFAFKGRNVDIETIARALNVGFILEGSVRRAGSQIRVTVQLVNGRDGFHAWSQDYDRDLKNVLVMQSDIASAVARQMQAKLLGDEASKIEIGGTRNPEAYDDFLRAREISFQTGELEHAIALAEKAVQLDPLFAKGWMLLAELYSSKSWRSASEPTWHARARTAAETALRLAPHLPTAHAVMADVAAGGLDWATASREVAAAEAINPTDEATLDAKAVLNAELGRWQDSITATRLLIESDPLDWGTRNRLAACLSATGRHREAEQVYRDIISQWPLNTDEHAFVAYEILLDHRPAEALAAAQLERDESTRNWVLSMIYYALGRQEESDRILEAYKHAHGSDDTFGIAVVHAYRGESDLAFQWLDRAVDQRHPGLSWIKANFDVFPNITNDPRYPKLLKRIGLPLS